MMWLPSFGSSVFFFFNDTATTEIYTLSLHDALPIFAAVPDLAGAADRSAARSKRYRFRRANLGCVRRANLSVAAGFAHDQPDGLGLCGSVSARGSMAGLWAANRGWGDSNRTTRASSRGPGTRRRRTGRRTAGTAAADHDRRRRMDRQPRYAAVALRHHRGAAPRCAQLGAAQHTQPAAGDRTAGRRTESALGPIAARVLRAACLHRRCRARAALAADGTAIAA